MYKITIILLICIAFSCTEKKKNSQNVKRLDFQQTFTHDDSNFISKKYYHEELIEMIQNEGFSELDTSMLDDYGLDSVFYKKYANYNWNAPILDDTLLKPPFDMKEPDPAFDGFVEIEKEPAALNMEKVLKHIQYPADAVKDSVKGWVKLKVLVHQSGYVKDYYIHSSPDVRLTHAVLDKCRFLHFTPATNNNLPVKTWANIAYEFK